MKTVYTLTEAQYRVLVRIEGHLSRDPATPLGVVSRRTYAVDLNHLLDSVVGTATMQVEPADRKAWAGCERRLTPDRRDSMPIIRRIRSAAVRPTGEQL